MRILIDKVSFEIFVNEGITKLTHSEIHDLDSRSAFFEGKNAAIKEMTIHEITSSWKYHTNTEVSAVFFQCLSKPVIYKKYLKVILLDLATKLSKNGRATGEIYIRM